MKYKITLIVLLLSIVIMKSSIEIYTVEQETEDRKAIYELYSKYTEIPWYLIGAIDQYERNIKAFKSYCPKDDELISICIDPIIWQGRENPFDNDNNPMTISMFFGIGLDGNNDGFADRLNPYDRLITLLSYLTMNGKNNDDIKNSLTDYYETEEGVRIIYEIAGLFQEFEIIDLSKRVFPIPKYYDSAYTNGFGAGRSYGGRRSHEGIDIFAHYGTPVLSTSYGVVEKIGWNRYGGYRIGIRDYYNTYQYYAHLQGYKKGLKEGDYVKPGDVIGFVGSTGYGKEGTSGRFAPHLHFGLYKYDGKREWSFNPYNFIRKWERISLR
ncbi:M23 family metallopeptidase [Mycoplasmatota bacterium zrk1]